MNNIYCKGQEFEEIFVIINFFNIKNNMYAISNYGKIKNIITGNMLSLIPSNGYRATGLQLNDNSRLVFNVHVLVATAFIQKTDEDIRLGRYLVNHKNLCRADNYVGNLEWATFEENNIHAQLNSVNLISPIDRSNVRINNWGNGELTAGENNGMSRLTESQVHIICQGLCVLKSYSECAIMAGLDNTENDRFLISSIAQRVKWVNVSSQYNFPDAKTIIDYSLYATSVCELLEKGCSVSVIVETLDLPGGYENARGFIGRIKRRESYTEISNNYNF